MNPCRLLILLAVGLGEPTFRCAAVDPDSGPDPSPEIERASFKVLEGFDVQLFASEKEGAIKPIAIRFDAAGRLWMVGSTAYPQIRPGETANDKVTIFEDTDGDGRADRSTVFADGLMLPLGLELGDRGAYVASATELVHVRDTDGDGRADERRVVLRGFGTGDAHQTINSFAWGPGGELMISQGLHAISRIETPWGLSELRQAGLFRFWPRRMKLEAFWTGAMGAHNPYGTVFDRWGQPFVFAGNGHGIYHLTQAMIETDHFLLQSAIWQQGRKFGGADVVENSHWPEANHGEFVSGGYLQNSVERFRIRESGSTFQAERLAPLIESTNTAFRIVDVRFGPDGALYLCDWYNTLIGHYQTSLRDPGRDRTRGRIWRVTAKGRPLVRWRNLEAEPTPKLLEQLQSPERWNRQMAKRVLADRPTPEVLAALADWQSSPAADSALPATEALGVRVSHESPDGELLGRLAQSAEPGARAYAARVLGHWATRIDRPLERLAPLIVDPHPRVRLEAIVACSYVPDPRAVEFAARATDHPMDPALEYAFTQTVHALKPRWLESQRTGLLTFGGQAHRAAAFARADGSGDTVAEAVSRLNRIGEVALEADSIERLARIVAENGGPGDLPVLLRARTFTLGDTALGDLQAGILDALWRRVSERPVLPSGNLAAQLAPLLANPSPAVRSAAMRLAGAWQVAPVRDSIAALAQDAGAEVGAREAALAALGGYARQDDRDVLLSVADSSAPDPVRVAAVVALTRFALDSAGTATAKGFLARTSNPPRDADLETIAPLLTAFLNRREGPGVLASALERQPPSVGAARVALAFLSASGRRDPRLTAVLEQAVGRGEWKPPTTDEIPALATEVRASGRPQSGKAIFERAALACVNCHATDGSPGKIGPDLGALGTAQTVEFILGAILDPQKEVKEGFVAHEIETRRGDIHQGYLRGETADEVSIHDHLENRVLRLRGSEIASRRQVGSLMPPGLADGLTREELRDLVAYLARLGRRD
ncbi:MAG: PVC-type heme-binding CxxCH protein [Limisphaerales bacterium]